MTELTDLELCRRIAEIEGIDILWQEEITGDDYGINDSLMMVTMRHENGRWAMCKEYNPLTNKGLLFDLMVKHKHLLDMDDHFLYMKDSDIPRAILTQIVENNGCI